MENSLSTSASGLEGGIEKAESFIWPKRVFWPSRLWILTRWWSLQDWEPSCPAPWCCVCPEVILLPLDWPLVTHYTDQELPAKQTTFECPHPTENWMALKPTENPTGTSFPYSSRRIQCNGNSTWLPSQVLPGEPLGSVVKLFFGKIGTNNRDHVFLPYLW